MYVIFEDFTVNSPYYSYFPLWYCFKKRCKRTDNLEFITYEFLIKEFAPTLTRHEYCFYDIICLYETMAIVATSIGKIEKDQTIKKIN